MPLYSPGAALCQKCTFGTDYPCDRPHGTDGDDGDSRDGVSADPFQSERSELETIYTPTPDDLVFIHRSTKSTVAAFGGMVLLKTFQRLGYFPPLMPCRRA